MSSFDAVTTLILSRLASFLPFFEVIPEIFYNFVSAVEMHYRKERSVKFYADLLCLSPKYLSSVIYKVSQKLAGEWIDGYVILEAKTLLKSGKLTIQQISEQLNFPNQSFCGKFFKRCVGMSPKEYKNK